MESWTSFTEAIENNEKDLSLGNKILVLCKYFFAVLYLEHDHLENPLLPTSTLATQPFLEQPVFFTILPFFKVDLSVICHICRKLAFLFHESFQNDQTKYIFRNGRH